MLRSVVSAMAAKMMLVQCGNSDVPISLACSAEAGDSPDHGIIGTASRLGPRRSAVRQTSTIWFWCEAQADLASIRPHPVKDGTDAPCQSHHRTLCASAFGHLRPNFAAMSSDLLFFYDLAVLIDYTDRSLRQ